MIPIAAKLKRFLTSHRVDYRLYCHPRSTDLHACAKKHNIPEEMFAQTVVLKAKQQYFVIVMPLSHQCDFESLNRQFKTEVYLASHFEADRLFFDCEPLSHPPIAGVYGLPVYIDTALLKPSVIYFEAGSHTSLMRLAKSDFCYLTAGATWGVFSKPAERCTRPNNIKSDKADLQTGPTSDKAWCMPDIAQKIVEISKDVNSTVDCLITLLQQDPLVNQTVESLKKVEQMHRVSELDPGLQKWLTFDTISHVTMPAKDQAKRDEPIQYEPYGALGLPSLWQHAKLSAALCARLAHEMCFVEKVDAQLCYIGALFQNTGFFCIAQLYPPEYRLLNRWFSIKAQQSITLLESRLIGLGGAQHLMRKGHERIGYWIMHDWNMPLPVQIMVKHHHNARFAGKFSPYVQLLLLVNQVLRAHRIGEGERSMSLSGLSLEQQTLCTQIVESELEKLKALQHAPQTPQKKVSW